MNLLYRLTHCLPHIPIATPWLTPSGPLSSARLIFPLWIHHFQTQAIKSIAVYSFKTLIFLKCKMPHIGPLLSLLTFHPVFLFIVQVIVQLYYSSVTLHVVPVMVFSNVVLVSPISRMSKLLSCELLPSF